MAKDKKDKKEVVKKKVPTPLKRNIQDQKKRMVNRALKSKLRTAIRSFEEVISGPEGQSALNLVYSLLDKAAKKGVFKLNKSSRLKARLTAKLAAAKP